MTPAACGAVAPVGTVQAAQHNALKAGVTVELDERLRERMRTHEFGVTERADDEDAVAHSITELGYGPCRLHADAGGRETGLGRARDDALP